ncbi:N-acetyltransferase [Phenylobacterium soli]|uniref:N-acetyltransferase n=2 Tax=Phenylobacterium soli TaxID=2170551 RepID=A0A328AMJ8_9CAUL|nr:N-acetyltransferase [Phenylobacterium soli]
MQLAHAPLENRFVRLEPMGEAHREDFRAACNEDEVTWQTLYPFSYAGEHFDPSWARVQRDREAGTFLPFAVVVDGRCRGISGYLTPEATNATVEIGGTWYHPDLRGGAVNPAAKRLLLGHAFDAGARRVQFKVDAINARSRAAVTKLGAVQEGILRQDRLCWTGRIRDTVYFSILRDEWPEVRERLEARLAAFERELADA